MELNVEVWERPEIFAFQLELGGDLVDDGARTAGALVVHAWDFALCVCLLVSEPDNDLRVLPSQFDDRTGVRVEVLHRQGHRVYFLNQLRADEAFEYLAAAACNEYANLALGQRERFLDAFEELQYLFGLLGLVPLVVLPENLVGPRVHHHRFDGCGTHVEPYHQILVLRIAFRSRTSDL